MVTVKVFLTSLLEDVFPFLVSLIYHLCFLIQYIWYYLNLNYLNFGVGHSEAYVSVNVNFKKKKHTFLVLFL